jgi:hypothetical protein
MHPSQSSNTLAKSSPYLPTISLEYQGVVVVVLRDCSSPEGYKRRDGKDKSAIKEWITKF